MYSENLLLVVLDDLIERRVAITQRKGVPCYLNYFDNILFLTFDFVQTVGILPETEIHYVDNPVITIDKNNIANFEKESNADLKRLLANPLSLFAVDIASTQKKGCLPDNCFASSSRSGIFCRGSSGLLRRSSRRSRIGSI